MRTQWVVLGVVGGLAALGLGVWALRSYEAASLNAKCVTLQSLAQQVVSNPSESGNVRAQVEQIQGTKFLSDLEWASWVAAQSSADCAATASTSLV